jgi:hypothetical protein
VVEILGHVAVRRFVGLLVSLGDQYDCHQRIGESVKVTVHKTEGHSA